MRVVYAVLVAVSAALLIGCTSYPLPKVSYEQPAAVASDLTASISLTSGVVAGTIATTMVAAGGMFIPVGGGSSPNWFNFNREDQAIYIACLSEELDRLGILKVTSGDLPRDRADIALNVVFEATNKLPNNDYVLQVELEISAAEGRQSKRYKINSLENEPGWMRITGVGAATGKKMAAQKLLNAMIPDIEDVVRRMKANISSLAPPSS